MSMRNPLLSTAVQLGRPAIAGMTLGVFGIGLMRSDSPSPENTAVMVVIVLLYHYSAVVTNDIVDLDVDRISGRRPRSPLIRGQVSVRAAARIAAATAIAMLIAEALRPGEHVVSFLLLTLSSALMAVYNFVGKKVPVPIVMDVLQGLSWAAFLLYVISGLGRTMFTVGDLLSSAAVGALMALLNGVHGAIRDLDSDREGGRITSAISLGVVGGGSMLVWSGRFKLYAVFLQLLVLALTLTPLLTSTGGSQMIKSMVALLASGALLVLICGLTKARSRDMVMWIGAWHMAALFCVVTWGATFDLKAVAYIHASAISLIFFAPMLVDPRFRWPRTNNLPVGPA